MTLHLLDQPNPDQGPRGGKIVRPLDMHVTEAMREEEYQMQTANVSERQQKIVAVIATHPGETIKGFEICQKLGIEVDGEFSKDMEVLKRAGLIEGMRGKGWKLPGAMSTKASLDYTLASKLEKYIQAHQEEQLTGASLAKLCDAALPKVNVALAYLKREKLADQTPGGWWKVPVKWPAAFGHNRVPAELAPRGNGSDHKEDDEHEEREVKPAAPAAPAPRQAREEEEDDEAAHFGIDERGRLAISKGKGVLSLEPEEIAVMEGFLTKTKALWNKED